MPAITTKWQVPIYPSWGTPGNEMMITWVEPRFCPNHRTYDPSCESITTRKWVDNYEFDDELEFDGFSFGRSAASTILKSKRDGKQYQMFMNDFSKEVPTLVGGVMTGRFTFCKRGQNYGITRA